MPWTLESARGRQVIEGLGEKELGRRHLDKVYHCVSRRQCVLTSAEGEWTLTALGKSPTFVQHKEGTEWAKVENGERVPLRSGTKIALDRSKEAGCILTLHHVAEAGSSSSAPPAAAPATAPAPAPAPAATAAPVAAPAPALAPAGASEEASPILPVAYPAAMPAPIALPPAAAAGSLAASSAAGIVSAGAAAWPSMDIEDEEAAAPAAVAAPSSAAAAAAAAADDVSADDVFARLSLDELGVLLRVAGGDTNGWFVAASLACTCRSLREGVSLWKRHDVTELRFVGVNGLDDELLRNIASTCARRLRTINVSKNSWITDGSVAQLVGGAPALQHLALSTCQHVSDPSLHALSTSPCATRLQFLDVSSCRWVTEAGVAAVAKSCVSLTHLNLSFCSRALTRPSLDAIAKQLPSLRRLALRVANRADAAGVTDEGIGAVAAGCPLLEHLDAAMCGFLTSAAVRAVASGCRKLRYLDVGDCAQIDAAGIGALAEHCHALEHLEARSLPLSSSSVAALAQRCPQLRHLSLDHCRQLDASAWAAIALDGQRLAFLSAVCAEGFDDAACRQMIVSCPALRKLRLGPAERHPGLSLPVLDELRAARHELDIAGGPRRPPSKKRRR